MDNNSYTMKDIESFLVDYRESQVTKPKDFMINIPIVGKKMYDKSFLEDRKRSFFEDEYVEAVKGSIEEQQEFIKKMSPILDDFYGVETKNEIKKK